MARKAVYSPTLDTIDDVKRWVREVLRNYNYDVRGVLLTDGNVLPIPSEPAVIAKLIETNLLEHFRTIANAVPQLNVHGAPNNRTYPDIWLTGDRLALQKVALEVKCARRAFGGHRTVSRITLGPYDKYFRRPDEKMPGCVMPYGEFRLHLDIIVLYDYDAGQILNVEPLVVETWRVASHAKSSGTRNYIGAVMETQRLRDEDGEFKDPDEFYTYWRSQPLG